MSTMLRVLLLMASILTSFWILRKIRKNRVKQEDALFWILFAAALAMLGIFPEISFTMARILGIQSPSNFVFLAVIAILLEKILSLSIQISVLESKVEVIAAELALRCKNLEETMGGKNAEIMREGHIHEGRNLTRELEEKDERKEDGVTNTDKL